MSLDAAVNLVAALLSAACTVWVHRREVHRTPEENQQRRKRLLVRSSILFLALAAIAPVVLYVIVPVVRNGKHHPAPGPPVGVIVSLFTMEPGYCFQAPGIRRSDYKGLPDFVRVVSCGEKHDAEVYFVGNGWTADVAFPGDDLVNSAAAELCEKKFTDYVGSSPGESVLGYYLWTPSKDSWVQDGDREVGCVAFHTREPIGRSVKGSKL
ncbi:septum formation family protein [Streptomyces sp. MST-110588]|uniref:septum formation family protein n=1 Tax=Streptomyces sp. MST-110588 TaxID=2833628 RepID=UPI001F5C2D58|nr:septum formation family protein [Streptomyces sp. MST-110588]UNO43391.1 septum formation family protein [Streptomyces sp. MST-110588]